MERTDSQAQANLDPSENEQKQKRKKLLKILIIIFSAVIIITSVVLYIYLYKIPHDNAIVIYNDVVINYNEAIANFNNATDQYNAAVTTLENKNKELDNSIQALTQVVNTENIPIDEYLLEEPQHVLDSARGITKDTAPEIPLLPDVTNEINVVITEKNHTKTTKTIESITTKIELATNEINDIASKIDMMIPEVLALGDYSDTLEVLSATENKYQNIIDQFKGCESNVVWLGVDEETTLLRFLVQFSNPNPYTLRNVTTEWIAYDKNDSIVGSHASTQTDIPANGSVYYVGGAGSAHLAGTPARVEVKITSTGLLTNRVWPQITVNNIQIKDHGYGWYEVSADCVTDSDIKTVDLNGQFIIKDSEGNIIDIDFWLPENLPDSIATGGKFTISVSFFDLPAKPESAEVYMCYLWE